MEMEASCSGHWARKLYPEEIDRLHADTQTLSDFKRTKLEKEAQKNWDRFYKRNETRFFKDRHWTTEEFQELCPDINFNAECYCLLEVGCGVGNFAFPFLEAFPRIFIHACDFSSRAIELVKANPKYDESRCNAFVCDLTLQLPAEHSICAHLKESSVDMCTMIFVMSAISPEKMQTAIDNIFKVLKAGGSVIFRDYGLYDQAMLRFDKGHKISDNFYVRQDGTRAFYFSEEKLKELFETSGFVTLSCSYKKQQTVNRKEGISVPRIFIQARFQKPTS